MLIFEACPALFGLPAGLVQDGLYGVMISCGEEIGRDWVGGGAQVNVLLEPLCSLKPIFCLMMEGLMHTGSEPTGWGWLQLEPQSWRVSRPACLLTGELLSC